MDRDASDPRGDPFCLPAKDQALLDSLVEASLAEVGTAPVIPLSFLPRPRRILEDEFEGWEAPDFGSPLQPARKVNPKFVDCRSPSPAVRAITGANPVATIQAANTRAIELLDYVIYELQTTRKKIVAGATGWPTISDALGQALQRRFRMDANDRTIWTSKGSRSVDVLIRRIRGARQILADGSMRYTCLGAATVTLGKCDVKEGNGCTVDTRAVSCGGHSRIVLCVPCWQDDNPPLNRLDSQARTLLHECLHIYFGRIGDEGIFTNAHCYDQFVLDLNGLAAPANRVGRCP